MINIEELTDCVTKAANDNEITELTRKYLLHGTPYVFDGRENDYYDFRNAIAKHFNIGFHEVFIVGSAKLGYSYYKKTIFSKDSDVDVVIVNNQLFEYYYANICDFQYNKDQGNCTLTEYENKQYMRFLQYLVKGWLRPDLLPFKLHIGKLKTDWFDFFKSISYGHSCVGDYKVSAGLFKNYNFLEKYYSLSLHTIKKF